MYLSLLVFLFLFLSPLQNPPNTLPLSPASGFEQGNQQEGGGVSRFWLFFFFWGLLWVEREQGAASLFSGVPLLFPVHFLFSFSFSFLFLFPFSPPFSLPFPLFLPP